jgi:integrase
MPSAVRLDEAIEEFLASRRARHVAANTIKSEKSMLVGFLTVTGNIYPRSIEPRHVDAWLAANQHWEPSTRRAQISRLRIFQTWLTTHKYISRGEDFLEGIHKVKVPKKRYQRVPFDQFTELLDRATAPRDRMIVATGLFLLVRASEITPMRWRDDLGEHMAIYRKKTGEPDDLPVGPDYREELDRWKRKLCVQMEVTKPDPSWYIHCAMMRPSSRDEKGLYTAVDGEYPLLPQEPLRHPRMRIKVIMAQLGIEERGTGMHTLRRSGARALFEELLKDGVAKDEALLVVSSMLGHASVQQTLVYIGWETTRAMRDKVILGRRMITPEAAIGRVVELRPRG